MAAGIERLAQAMATQGAARLEQAGRAHEAQEAADRAEDARVAALNERVTQLQTRGEQDRVQSQAEIVALRGTVVAQAELIAQLMGRLNSLGEQLASRMGALELAHRSHAHEYQMVASVMTEDPGCDRYIPGVIRQAPTKTSPPK